MEKPVIDAKGSCHCGAVRFRIQGEMMLSAYCHCRNCTASKGASPVHLLAISGADSFQVEDGSGETATRASGRMRFTTCATCHGPVVQHPDGAPFRVVFPINLELGRGEAGEDHGADRIPDEWAPQMHLNYENRLFDWSDGLPKFKVFVGGDELAEDGHAK
ncbi:MAG: GFA family protein [Planctomycetota bacterium]|jgi:hypothetical protein